MNDTLYEDMSELLGKDTADGYRSFSERTGIWSMYQEMQERLSSIRGMAFGQLAWYAQQVEAMLRPGEESDREAKNLVARLREIPKPDIKTLLGTLDNLRSQGKQELQKVEDGRAALDTYLRQRRNDLNAIPIHDFNASGDLTLLLKLGAREDDDVWQQYAFMTKLDDNLAELNRQMLFAREFH